MTVTSCAAAVVLLGGCAHPTASAPLDPTTVLTAEDESWMACGATVFLERDDDADQPSRREAIESDLAWYQKALRHEVELTSEVPAERYVELLEAALGVLPAAERDAREDGLLRLSVVDHGSDLGIVELGVDYRGEYFVSELVFSPRQPESCGG